MSDSEKAAVFRVSFGAGRKPEQGTGFLVAEDLVLTARHVVVQADGSHGPDKGVIRVEVPDDRYIGATIEIEDPDADWALLRLREKPEGVDPIPLRDTSTIQADEQEWDSWGFPGVSLPALAVSGIVEDWTGSEDSKRRVQLHLTQDTLPPAGLSGAPVMMKGCAVGIIVDMLAKGSLAAGGILFATPTERILPELPLAELPRLRTRFTSPDASDDERLNLKLLDELRLQRIDPAAEDGGRLSFQIMAALAGDYDHLMDKEFSKTDIAHDQILDLENWDACFLFHAPGGTGKTQIMCALARSAVERDIHTFYLRLGGQSERLGAGPTFNEIVDICSLTARDFKGIPEQASRVLLLVDGLNELEGPLSRLILEELRKGSMSPRVRLIVADRMNRRDQAARFHRLTVLPLEREAIAEYLEESGRPDAAPEDELSWDLLSTPFFLDLYLDLVTDEGDDAWRSKIRRGDILGRYFEKIVKVEDERLRQVAKAAYDAYVRWKGPEFDEDWVVDAAPLQGAGLTVPRGEGRFAFRHQLLHDYLVGLHLAHAGRAAWNESHFDNATLYANSPEPVFYATDHVSQTAPKELPRLLFQIYDWNVDTAFESIADLSATYEEPPVPEDLKRAITALYAQRCHERVLETAKRTKDTLRRMQLPEAKKLAELSDRAALLEEVGDWELEPEYEEWQTLFLMQPEEEVSSEDILKLNGNPLIGWTAANVFRMLPLSSERLVEARFLYRVFPEKRSLHWRIVHLLGNHASTENVEFLKEAARGASYSWVVYGAVRSLMEIASLPDSEHRDGIIDWIDEHIRPETEPRFLRAVRWAVIIRDADRDWYVRTEELLTKALEFVPEESEWRATLEKVRKELGGHPG